MKNEQAEKTIDYWLTSAEYDVGVARSLKKLREIKEMFEWLKMKLKIS